MHGITLPSPKKTRARIVHMFKQQMYLLKKRLSMRIHTFPSSLTHSLAMVPLLLGKSA